MIRPIDAYPGKVATPTTEYPYGKAQNITSPGDGTGTPWEAKLVNDLFGFQQFITAKAGITPNGTPDNATASQQFDALWKLLNVRPLTFNLTVDANYTLTADQNLYGNLTITDTGVVLTAARDIIVDTVGRLFLFTNSTAQTLTVRTLAGTGIAVAAGASVALICDETDVLDFGDFSGVTLLTENQTVTVGSGGDYATINEALAYLSTLYPLHKISGVTAEISLLSGFVMQEQVLVYGLNLGWITITSVDSVVTIDNTSLTTVFETRSPAFGVIRGGTLPQIGALFQFDVAGVGGVKDGVYAFGVGSSASVLNGCGIKDAGSIGIFASRGSTINADGANTSGAGVIGINASRGSTINADGANASGAGSTGILVSRGSTINADGATGTLSQTANTLTSSGIIFQ